MRDWLREYPHLTRFCEEENIEELDAPRKDRHLVLKDIVARNVPGQSAEIYRLRRERLDHMLELAYRHCMLDKHRRSSLKSDDYVPLESFRGELKVAVWLEALGCTLSFDPPAAGDGKGDVEIRGPFPVFVEVKSLFGDELFRKREDVVDRLAQELTRRAIPAIEVDLVEYAPDFSPTRLVRCLQPALATLGSSERTARVTYRDPKGLVAEIVLKRGTEYVRGKLYSGFVATERTLRRTIREAQHSPKPISNLVVVNDTSRLVGSTAIEDILYGTLVTNVTCGQPPLEYRASDGIWTPRRLSPRSAVAIYQERWQNCVIPQVRIYLSPGPCVGLPRRLFGTSVSWFELEDDGMSVQESRAT